MINSIKKIVLLCLLLVVVGETFALTEQHQKTGYFTMFYAREHVSDMPREFFLLIEEDRTIVPVSFHEHKSSGKYSIWNFDPHVYLGKTITIDVQAEWNRNNNEFNYYEGSKLKVLPRLQIETINSFVESGTEISAPAEYRYPQTDTLLMPHDVVIAEENYENKTPTETVQLIDYVDGEGTEESPFISADGYAGLKDAINDLPNGGTIEVSSGVYKATSKRLNIPRFVSIKGVGDSKPYFILADERMWYLKGGNTIDNIDIDVTQIDRDYTHEVVAIHDNAKYVTIKNTKFIGNYKVDPDNNFEESGRLVMVRLYSHLKDITFEKDTFMFPLRAIATKGQKNQHNITFRECLWEGQGHMCITLDQSSNISNVVIENNKFIEFSHFGIALARINDVVIRNNTFYSRNLESYKTYNQALHIEEHTQNILIEDNVIDVTLRNSGSTTPGSPTRSFGIIVMDSRNITIRNNDIKHNSVQFGATTCNLAGYSEFSNNQFEDGALHIKDANKQIVVKNNEFINPPEFALSFYSTKPMLYPFGWHKVESNNFKEMDGKQAFAVRGQMKNTSIKDNVFVGCNQKPNSIELYSGSENFEIRGNKFYGLASSNAFTIEGNLPAGNTVTQYQSANTFTSDCTVVGLQQQLQKENNFSIYPNPVNSGDMVFFEGERASDLEFTVYSSAGKQVRKGKGNKLNTTGFQQGIYLMNIQTGKTMAIVKLVVN